MVFDDPNRSMDAYDLYQVRYYGDRQLGYQPAPARTRISFILDFCRLTYFEAYPRTLQEVLKSLQKVFKNY